MKSALALFLVFAAMTGWAAAATIGNVAATTIQNPPSVGDEVTGPDGNVWFTAWKENAIGMLAPGGSVKLFPMPAPTSTLLSITEGVDGNLWFTEVGRVGRISTSGDIKEFPYAAGTADFLRPIVSGSDGSLWFLDQPAGPPANLQLVRMTLDGKFTSFNLGSKDSFGAMIEGPDGNLWIYDHTANAVLKVSEQNGATIAKYPFTSPAGTIGQRHFVLGPDGNLWLTHGPGLARIQTNGTIVEYPIPTPGDAPTGLVVGSDSNLWFSEYTSGRIGRLVVSSATATGQATVDESAPILGSSSVDLVALTGPVQHTSVSGTGAVTEAIEYDPCVNHTVVTRKTDEQGNWIIVTETVPPLQPCADLVAKAMIPVRYLKDRGLGSGAATSVVCVVTNAGLSAATNVVATCSSNPDSILTDKGSVKGKCTSEVKGASVILRTPSLAFGEKCEYDAPYDVDPGVVYHVTMVVGSDTTDPVMKNNAYEYSWSLGAPLPGIRTYNPSNPPGARGGH